MNESFAWPPKKEDLESLYVVEGLSASKIARVYGLRYKNPKVAESTVLYQLKRNGIQRRDPAQHVRKVTEDMVDEWISRYKASESLKQIAGGELTPAAVLNHLRKRGVRLRDKVEAQIAAVTKHERKPFRGNDVEKAYLMGLRYGDLDAVRHGRAIRVRVSTTHPAMAGLFDSLFSPYGFVQRYPRKAELTGYEWTLECDLDRSFGFLLKKPKITEMEKWDRTMFLAFLAGLFDAEGSVLLHKKGKRHNPEVTIPNVDRSLLDFLCRRLTLLEFHVYFSWRREKYNVSGRKGEGDIGRLIIWRFREVQSLLRQIHLRHREKAAKAAFALELEFGKSDQAESELFTSWRNLKSSIEIERNTFIQAAGSSIARKRSSTNP